MRQTSTLSGRRARNASSRPAEARRSTLATTRDPGWQDRLPLSCAERGIRGFDEGDRTEIGILGRARLKLIHHVAEAESAVQVGKADRAPGALVPEGSRIRAERRDECPDSRFLPG